MWCGLANCGFTPSDPFCVIWVQTKKQKKKQQKNIWVESGLRVTIPGGYFWMLLFLGMAVIFF